MTGLRNPSTSPTKAAVLLEQICRCPTLPSLPAVVMEVLKATSRQDADLARLSDVVSKDAALVARILRSVNSSHFGMRHKITSIGQALPVLGLRNLRTLLMGLSVFPAMKKCRPPVLDHGACCRRSLYSAAAARMWADELKVANSDDCFLAALLMDIGVLAIAEAAGEEYGNVLGKAERHADLDALERHQLGLSHAEVGAALAKQWQLPANLIEPIRFHHDPGAAPEGPARAIARVARLSGVCADIFVEHNPLWPISEGYRLGAEDFGLSRPAVDKILEEIASETRRLGATFEVKVEESATFAQAQTRIGEEFAATAAQDMANPRQGAEHRREARAAKSGSIVVVPCAGPVIGKPCRAEFGNVSPSGLGLVFLQPIERDSRFAITLRGKSGRLTVVLYRVVYCRPEAGAYVVGAELIRATREAESKPATPCLHATSAS